MKQLIAMLVPLLTADKLGGYVRGLVAALLGSAAGWFGGALVPFLTGEMQTAIGVVVSGVAVGLWSHIAKAVAGLEPAKS